MLLWNRLVYYRLRNHKDLDSMGDKQFKPETVFEWNNLIATRNHYQKYLSSKGLDCRRDVLCLQYQEAAVYSEHKTEPTRRKLKPLLGRNTDPEQIPRTSRDWDQGSVHTT